MNELMNNEVFEEVTDTAIETVAADPKKTFLIGAGVGAGMTIVGGIVYNKVIKPGIAKLKARRAAKQLEKNNETIGNVDTTEFDFDEEK